LGWEDCVKLNERLIYASITGVSAGIVLYKWLISRGTLRIWPNGALLKSSRLRCGNRSRSWINAYVRLCSNFIRALNSELQGSTGEPDGPPCKVGVAVTDVSTGLYAHGAIMAALLSRQRTGKGVWIDCNLFDTQVLRQL
jgi:succinate--hydroxymethylglutarate CoA-transferase